MSLILIWPPETPRQRHLFCEGPKVFRLRAWRQGCEDQPWPHSPRSDEVSDSDSDSAKTQAIVLWGGIGAGVLVLGGLLTLLIVKKPWRKKRTASSSRIHSHARRPATSPASPPVKWAKKSRLPLPTPGYACGPGLAARTSPQRRAKRKKRFSFYAFHSDMVMT